MKSRRTLLAWAAFCPLLAPFAVSAPAFAADAVPEPPSVAPAPPDRAAAADSWMTKPNEHRAGLVIGLGLGVGMGGAYGYPNKASQIGDSSYYASSGIGAGSTMSLFVLGALSDYFNFGFFFGDGSSKNDAWKTSTFGIGFRIEAFPLYGVAKPLRDLGVAVQLGLGSTKIDALRGAYPGADGVQSYLGLGAFYEWRIARIFSGHLAGGPSVDYSAALTRSVDRHDLSVGGRLVLYTAL